MKEFFRTLGAGTKKAVGASVANPKTTVTGLMLIAGALLPQFTGEITTAGAIATKILLGAGLLLAKDATN